MQCRSLTAESAERVPHCPYRHQTENSRCARQRHGACRTPRGRSKVCFKAVPLRSGIRFSQRQGLFLDPRTGCPHARSSVSAGILAAASTSAGDFDIIDTVIHTEADNPEPVDFDTVAELADMLCACWITCKRKPPNIIRGLYNQNTCLYQPLFKIWLRNVCMNLFSSLSESKITSVYSCCLIWLMM